MSVLAERPLFVPVRTTAPITPSDTAANPPVPVIPGNAPTAAPMYNAVSVPVAKEVYATAERVKWFWLYGLWLTVAVETLAYSQYVHGVALQLFTFCTVSSIVIALACAVYALSSPRTFTYEQTGNE